MKTSKFLSVLLMVVIAVGAFAFTATAEIKDTSKDVSLTIYALETADGSEVTVDESAVGEKVTLADKKPIPGVSFNLYKVAGSETSTDVPSGVDPITTGKTNSDGAVTIVIPASAQGRYLVVENEKPDYAQDTTIPFLVDLPMTNPRGTGFLYDVFVYPKQVVKHDTDTDTELPPPDTDTDTDSEPDIPEPNIDKKVSGDNGKTWSDQVSIDVINGVKPYWKITADISDFIGDMDVFFMTDHLDNRLIPPTADEVKVSVGGKELSAADYKIDVKSQSVTVNFVPKNLVPYAGDKVDVIFPTAVDITSNNSLGVVIENIATLNYSETVGGGGRNNYDTDTLPDTDTETTGKSISTTEVKILVGEIDGYKHDKDNKPLADAEFTLYSDKSCKNEIAKTTSNKDGHFYFQGLANGTYYVKETKAPNGYQANTNVFEVKIDVGNFPKPVEIDVLNVPKPNLPVTGGAGIIGISVIGLSIAVLGVFVIYYALRVRKREKYAVA